MLSNIIVTSNSVKFSIVLSKLLIIFEGRLPNLKVASSEHWHYQRLVLCSADTMDQSGITPNTSNQQLVINSDNESATALLQEKQTRRTESLRDVSIVDYMTVGILCFVNLINYMDRFTLAGKMIFLLHFLSFAVSTAYVKCFTLKICMVCGDLPDFTKPEYCMLYTHA